MLLPVLCSLGGIIIRKQNKKQNEKDKAQTETKAGTTANRTHSRQDHLSTMGNSFPRNSHFFYRKWTCKCCTVQRWWQFQLSTDWEQGVSTPPAQHQISSSDHHKHWHWIYLLTITTLPVVPAITHTVKTEDTFYANKIPNTIHHHHRNVRNNFLWNWHFYPFFFFFFFTPGFPLPTAHTFFTQWMTDRSTRRSHPVNHHQSG